MSMIRKLSIRIAMLIAVIAAASPKAVAQTDPLSHSISKYPHTTIPLPSV